MAENLLNLLPGMNAVGSDGWFGKVYLGAPLEVLVVPANIQNLRQKKRWAKHPIPGRDGDMIDNMGSPSRAVKLSGKISPEILRAHYPAWLNIIDPFQSKSNPITFMTTLNEWWLRGLEIPLISDPIVSIFVIEELNWTQVGGKPGQYKFEMIVVEKLPYSLSSVRGMIMSKGLFMGMGALTTLTGGGL